jgi:hypothetical protein
MNIYSRAIDYIFQRKQKYQEKYVVSVDLPPPVLDDPSLLENLDIHAVDKAVRIFLIGDSHCLPARDLLISDKFTGINYTIVSKYIPGFSGCSTIKGNEIAPQFLAALESENLIRDGNFTHLSISEQDLAASFAAGLSGNAPIIVLSVGDIDLRSVLLSKLNDNYDLVLPFNSAYGVRKGVRIMPYSVAYEIARKQLASLIEIIRKLRSMGLHRVLFLELPPPSLSQEQFDKIHGFSCPAMTRYKATMVFNKVLDEICLAEGATLVKYWSDVLDKDGWLKKEFELDGVHLNRDANIKIMKKIIYWAVNQGRQYGVNSKRHELAYKLSEHVDEINLSDNNKSLSRVYHEEGLCRTIISNDIIESINKELNYDLDVGNRHARIDWSGNPVTPFSEHMKAAVPNHNILEILYHTLYETDIYFLIQACMGKDVHFVNCRPFMSINHEQEGEGPQSFHYDGCPPHVIRAILYLVDVDETNGPFEYVNKEGVIEKLTGPKGTFFIFDANRLLHRANPPREKFRQSIDFVILPRMKSQKRSVLWAGINNWPNDPFNFTVNGMLSYPINRGARSETNPLSG